ncbi:MAG: fatty acid desaturase [Pseudomonadota bacterium]
MSQAFPQDDPDRFKALTTRPKIAWPTLLLMVASGTLFLAASAAFLTGAIGVALMVGANTVAFYLAFTVAHDASHNAVSSIRPVNDGIGRLATLFLFPLPVFRMFRFVHMQHHRFTNDPDRDPDLYCGRGHPLTLPLRWATLDLRYFVLYLRPDVFGSRPVGERREFLAAVLLGVALITLVISQGWLVEYLLLFLLPSRLNVFLLALAFDFLPHYPHEKRAGDAPFEATSNRVGLERLLTPLLLSQNYHLVHHLYPTVPFYRYLRVWKARAAYHRAQRPAEVAAFSLTHRTSSACPAEAGRTQQL